MSYYSKQIENGRWGIYIDHQLVATIGCFDTCQKIVQCLETRLVNSEISDLTSKNSVVPYFMKMKLRA